MDITKERVEDIIGTIENAIAEPNEDWWECLKEATPDLLIILRERVGHPRVNANLTAGRLQELRNAIVDVLGILQEKAQQIKAGATVGAGRSALGSNGPNPGLLEGSTPSPGSSDEDERALDTLQDAAREGYPYVYEFESDKELWWSDVLRALAYLRSRLSKPVPPAPEEVKP